MTALWISLAVVIVVLVVWRLRRAKNVLDNILREERELSERETAADVQPDAEQRDPEPRDAEHRRG